MPVEDDHFRKKQKSLSQNCVKLLSAPPSKQKLLYNRLSLLSAPLQDLKNKIQAEITGKRHREIGLVVPAKLVFLTDNQRYAEVLENELMKQKEKISKCTGEFPLKTPTPLKPTRTQKEPWKLHK